MANEKEEELPEEAKNIATGMAFGAILKNPWILLIILAVIAVLIAAFIFLIPSSYKTILLVALAALLIVFLLSKKEQRAGRIILVIGLAAVLIIFPQIPTLASEAPAKISSAYNTAKSSGIGSGLSCIGNIDKCYGAGAWEETKTYQDFGLFSMDIDWGDKRVTTPLYKVVGLKVKTDMDLELTPKCYLDKDLIETVIPSGSTLKFKSSKEIQQSSITCKSDKITSDRLAVKITANNLGQTLKLVAKVGKGADQGILSAENKSGPFSIKVESPYDKMPFDVGNYPLNVKITGKDMNITQIKSLRFDTLSGQIKIECNFGDELKADSSQVSKWLEEKGINCNLNVLRVPNEGMEQAIINVAFKYDIEKVFKTNLNSTSQ